MNSANPPVVMATGIAKWLRKLASSLEDKLLCFEAGDTHELADSFDKFAEDDMTLEGFGVLWQELQDWAETSIVSGSREKSLCNVPSIPRLLEY